MLTRPFAPFRARPLREQKVAKALSLEELFAMAEAGPPAVKGQRKSLKGGKPSLGQPPRILDRARAEKN